MFFLFNILIVISIVIIGFGLRVLTEKTGMTILFSVYLIAVMMPSCAVTIRRLHDTDRSAWFFLAGLIPIVGWIWLFIVLASKGSSENNKYGKNPETFFLSYNRRRSASVALILSSFFWLFSYLLIFLFTSDWNEGLYFKMFLPVGLIIIGIILFIKRAFSANLALVIIVLSILWLVQDVLLIRDVYAFLFDNFNILLLINQFVVFVPIALLLTGLYILIKKTDRTVPVCFLFAGAIIWIFSLVWSIVQIDVSKYDLATIMSLLSNAIVITVPVSLLVFARTLLSKDKPVKELSNPKQIEKKTTLEPVVQPVIQSEVVIPIVEPIIEPDVVILKVEPSTIPIQPIISENRKKVIFLREDKDDKNIWVVYKAPTKVDAMAFLSKITIEKPSYYVIVETPEGNFGRDKDGFYQE